MGKPLKNLKHERFCWEYLKDLHVTNAAIRTGYKQHSAHVQGSVLLKHPKVSARVQEIIAERSGELGITDEWVIGQLKKVVERCMQPEPVMVWDYEKKQLVQKTNEEGNLIFEFDSNGANKALELLGKHLGLFEKDNLQRQTVINVNILNVNGGNSNEEQAEAGSNNKHSIGSVFAMLPPPSAITG
jgi:phage terminase small subunit